MRKVVWDLKKVPRKSINRRLLEWKWVGRSGTRTPSFLRTVKVGPATAHLTRSYCEGCTVQMLCFLVEVPSRCRSRKKRGRPMAHEGQQNYPETYFSSGKVSRIFVAFLFCFNGFFKKNNALNHLRALTIRCLEDAIPSLNFPSNH